MSVFWGPKGRSIVVLTGAGISKESGIDTFRDGDGLWAKHRIEDVATLEAYKRNPELVQNFYNERRKQMLAGNTKPNAAHEALAQLELDWAHPFFLVTQNIDDLHDRAGSRNLLHMHGEILKTRCDACGNIFECREDVTAATSCRNCGQYGNVRPQIVWFGEIPFGMDAIFRALHQCGLFLSIGTSGNVYPAAQFVEVARAVGACTVELNLEPSICASKFSDYRYGPATKVVPDFVKELLNSPK